MQVKSIAEVNTHPPTLDAPFVSRRRLTELPTLTCSSCHSNHTKLRIRCALVSTASDETALLMER